MIATAPEPIGGETTVIALDPVLASIGRFPALDLFASGTIRPELLVGEAGAEAIAAGAGRGSRRGRDPVAVSRRCSGCGAAASAL